MQNKATMPKSNNERDRPRAVTSRKQIADAKRANNLLSILSGIKTSKP